MIIRKKKKKILPEREFYKINLYFSYIYIWTQIDKQDEYEYMYMTFLYSLITTPSDYLSSSVLLCSDDCLQVILCSCGT